MIKYEPGSIKADDVYPKRGSDGKIHLGNFPGENAAIISPNDDSTSLATSADSGASEVYADYRLEPLPEEGTESDDTEDVVYLTQDMVDAIAMEDSILSSRESKERTNLELLISRQFVDSFGVLMTEEQKEYFFSAFNNNCRF